MGKVKTIEKGTVMEIDNKNYIVLSVLKNTYKVRQVFITKNKRQVNMRMGDFFTIKKELK